MVSVTAVYLSFLLDDIQLFANSIKTNLYNEIIQIQFQMGQNISIDKRSICVHQWLQNSVELDLRNIDIAISNHIIVWKFFTDNSVQTNRNDSNIYNPNEIQSKPIFIQMITGQTIFNPYQTYIILFIKDKSKIKTSSHSKIPATLRQLLNSIQINIQENSYTIQLANILSKQPQQISQFGQNSYYSIHTYFGKYSTSALQMHTLTKAYELHKNIFSDVILSLLCSGRELKNKKWNKTKVQNLCNDGELEINELKKFSKIALLRDIIPQIFTDQKLTIFQIKPKQKLEMFKGPPVPVVGKLNLSKINNFVNNSQSQQPQPQPHNDKQPQKPSTVKPPMLKLTLKPYEQVTYDQIAQQQATGNIKFDIRATARHELKMEKFQKQCNEIVDGLFVSGQKAAKDIETLKKFQIEDIVNCAGDYCENWFENQGFNYLTLFLKDSQNQNIQCLFYRVIDFIENAKKNNRKVLIHCIQGISRSVSFCIAYLIFTYGYDYKKSQAFIKQKRGIASPNNGFMVELIQFHKRLYDKHNALPSPRVFLVSSHSKETPHLITARMIKHPLFNDKKYVGLDCRTVYIIQTEHIVYLWVGSKCDESQLQKYWSYAQQYIKKLQRYEHAPVKVKAISQGSQGPEFYQLWNLQEMPELYQNNEYNNLFLDGQGAKAGNLRKYYQKQEDKQITNRLFIYPDYQNGLGVFELDDLNGFCVLVHNQDGQHLKIFLWKDGSNKINEDSESQFLDNVLRSNYSQYEPQNIDIEQESAAEPSQNFVSCFS